MGDQVTWGKNEGGELVPSLSGRDVVWAPQRGGQEAFLSCPVTECLLEGMRGTGKGLPLDEPVWTPRGPRPIGSLKVGSPVCCPDGTKAAVIGVYPQGVRPVYEIEFDDGAVARCDDLHLWPVHEGSEKRRERQPGLRYKLMTMARFAERFRSGRRLHVPTLDELTLQDNPRWRSPWLNPYLLGLVLGDGCLTQGRVSFCSTDDELCQVIMGHGFREEPPDPRTGVRGFTGKHLRDRFKRLGLMGTDSSSKFVPNRYKIASTAVRLAVLQGLMDTDGDTGGSGAGFLSKSEALANDVVFLARSLGGKASVRRVWKTCQTGGGGFYHRVYMQPGRKFCPFRLSRKASAYHPHMHELLWRRAVRVTELPPQETVCIKIDHPAGLFVTRDFVVTHNTDALLMDFAQHVGCGHGADWRGLLFRHTYKQLQDVVAKSKKWFPRIFPLATFNEAAMRWSFPRGEELMLSYMERQEDYWNYHGQQFTWIAFEELTTWPDDSCYKVMLSCLRSSNPRVPRKYRATTNPYGPGHCVPYGEVMTPGGWVGVEEVKVGDPVFTFDERGVLRESRCDQVFAEDYDGDIIVRKGRGLEMAFTPGHQLPSLREDGSVLMRQFDDLPGQVDVLRAARGWEGRELLSFTVPSTYQGRKRRRTQPLTLGGEDFATLCGWYLSEGYCCERDGAVSIAQTKPESRRRLEEFLVSRGFEIGRSPTGVWFSSKEWCDYFSQFGLCDQKFVPQEIKGARSHVLRAFLASAMEGDGYWRVPGESGAYTTTSERLADDVCEIAVKLGYCVYVGQRDRLTPDERPKKRCYDVQLSGARPVQLLTGNKRYDVAGGKTPPNVRREKFKGRVFCIGVPDTHSFVIRQGPCIWLSGNSWVKARFQLPVPPGRTVGRFLKDPPRVVIHSHLSENKVLTSADPDYIKRVAAAARNVSELKAWTEGDWDVVAGGMFDDVWAPDHCVVPDFDPADIPGGWRIDRSYDHGQSKPFSVGWWAESNGEPMVVGGRTFGQVRKDIVRFDEWYGWSGQPNSGLRMTAVEIAEGIVGREDRMGIRGRIRQGPADSSIFDEWEPGKSVAGDMAKRGVHWNTADKRPGSRKQGWQQLRQLLKGSVPSEEGVRESPGLFVCERCDQFRRTVPSLPRDERDLDDVDTDAEDHVADETRYRVRGKLQVATSRSW